MGACFNAGLLLRGLRRRDIYTPLPGWSVFLSKLGIAVCVMFAILWFAAGPDAGWIEMDAAERVLRLAGIVILGAVSYFAALWLLGFRLRDFARAIKT